MPNSSDTPEPPPTFQIPILSWFDRPVKQAVWSVFNDLNKATEALDLFRRYRKSHFDRLKGRVRKVKLLGMTEPVLLTDIYRPAMVSTTIYRRLYAQDWQLVSSSTKPVRRPPVGRSTRADEFIEAHSRVTVLGSAGSGKTTLLRHLALSLCDKTVFKSTNLQTSRFPFLVDLLAYSKTERSGEQPLLAYLANELRQYTDDYAQHFVKRLLKKGLATLILDSLDEVPPSARDAVMTDIRKVSDGYPHCHVVVSCRTADYEPIGENFYEVELARLTGRCCSYNCTGVV